jgi:hypothetical protein
VHPCFSANACNNLVSTFAGASLRSWPCSGISSERSVSRCPSFPAPPPSHRLRPMLRFLRAAVPMATNRRAAAVVPTPRARRAAALPKRRPRQPLRINRIRTVRRRLRKSNGCSACPHGNARGQASSGAMRRPRCNRLFAFTGVTCGFPIVGFPPRKAGRSLGPCRHPRRLPASDPLPLCGLPLFLELLESTPAQAASLRFCALTPAC